MIDKEQMGQLIREEVSELLAEMEAALLELEQTPEDMSLVNRVFRAMHTVKGAANMFGFDAVASLTHEVESLFDAVRSGRVAVSRTVLDIGLEAKDLTWQLIEEPEDSQVLAAKDALLEHIARAAGAPDMSSSASQETVSASVEGQTTEEHAASADVLEKQAAALASYSVVYRPDEEEGLSLASPLDVLDELRTLGDCEVFLHAEDVPLLESLQEDVCRLWWEVLLTKEQEEGDFDRLQDLFIFMEDPAKALVEVVEDPQAWIAGHEQPPEEDDPPLELSLPASVSQALAEPEETASPEPASPSSPPASREAAARNPRPSRNRKENASVRVDAYKLDDMVALVGELVIAQARLSQIVGQLHEPALQGVVEELELLSNSLRDRTLSMRMLPIGSTFDRFRRLVRDLSQELGKEIKLETRGAETELDKTVIEQLGDPLVHLLRNAIDHGVETPEERISRGKKRAGKITLSAEHSGGHVLIAIQDDGKGLDRERIAAKALERGLITDAVNLTDKEIYRLIFHPGFSTADKITSVSGRGVGMDVVKKNIDHLRGAVDLDSEKGVGTTVTIKLPLTLAIIEGLQVRVGGEFFVIPLAAVQECVELAGENVSSENEGNKKIINLRNEIVPYIRLREWFSIPGERPSIEQIIIAGDNTRRTGIVVDEVIGQQQTVIKSLGKVFKEVQEISGATIKGDGTMALILDIPSLISKVLDANRSAGRRV